MKTKLIIRSAGLFILICSLFIIYSCTKSDNASSTKDQNENQYKNTEATSIDEKDFTESDEDLTTVDYKEIYDRLTPHGEWLEVSPEEIGIKPETALFEDSGNRDLLLSEIFGIKVANATSVANAEMVYVWKPSADLGVTVVAGEPKLYIPYTNGQWVNTDAGWYFKAPTPVEETVSHYGRWVNSPTAGWLWVPGRVWAPAWVDWKQNDSYVSWAPLPPSVYLNNGTISVPTINDNNYVIVEKKYFLEPDVYKYNTVYYDNRIRIPVSEMIGTEGLIVVNNTIINRGPDVNIFQNLLGRNIEIVKLQRVGNYKEVRYSDRQYIIYTPVFKRYKNKGNKRVIVNVPESYKKYDERNVSTYKDRESGKNENEVENKGSNNGDKNRNNDNSNKNNDGYKGNKHDAGDNGNKNNGNNNGNDNGNKNNENNNGNNNGNDKGNKHNGNDNNSKDNGNDKGSKDNGHDKGSKDNGKGKK